MFNAYEFIFAGMPSSMYGLVVCDFDGNTHSNNPFGNKAEIIETRIPGRVRPLHYGVDYHKSPLSFTLIFGCDRELDRWEMEEISHWLTGHQQYQWLSIEQPDLDHVEFRCLIEELKPLSVGWIPYAFEATVKCDCPYAYGFPFEYTYDFSDGDEIVILNTGSAREYCYPVIDFVPASSCTQLEIVNYSDINHWGDPTSFFIGGIPTGSPVVHIDCMNCIIEDRTFGTDLYDGFNDNFFRLIPGENILALHGSGALTISGRYYYNVGA